MLSYDMTAKVFYETLVRLLGQDPFQAFAVELHDGKRIEIDRPKSTAVREGMAIFLGVPFSINQFDYTMVKSFIERSGTTSSRKRNKSKKV
jgi:hypothetical protein